MTNHTTTKKIMPVIFICVLVSICLFFIGIQYGRKVAETDKKLQALRTTSPTKSPSPTPEPSVYYLNFESEECDISFLYPSNLEVSESENIIKAEGNNQNMQIICDILDLPENKNKESSTSVMFNEATISATLSNFLETTKEEELLVTIQDAKTKKKIYVISSPALYPLLATSLTFK